MRKWYEIKNENTLNIKARRKYRDVFILDEIGGYGVYARDFIKNLTEVDADTINLHIDSPGGSITDGVAIYNALRGWSNSKPGRQVDVYISGIAASIASIVILAGDRVFIAENASVFTHLPMLAGLDMPNRADLDAGLETLSKFETVLKNIYMKHTGADEATVTSWMEEEKFFFGQEAVDAGFATEVTEAIQLAAQYNPKKYAFLNNNQKEGDIMQDEQINSEAEVEVQETETIEAAEEVAAIEETEVEASEVVEVEAVISEDEVSEESELETAEEIESEEEAEEVDAVSVKVDLGEELLALTRKYNVEKDMKDQLIEALINKTSVEDFKDEILETLASRPTSKAIVNKSHSEEVAELRAKLANASPSEKFIISKKIKSLR